MKRLYQYFLRSFFVSDAVARSGDPRALAITAAAFFSAPAIAISMYLSMFAGSVDTTPLLAFFVALSLILTGLLALVEWEELFPGRRDVEVLGPLPLLPGAIVGAKLAALVTLLAGFAVIVNFYSNLMLPVLSVPQRAGMGTTVRWMGAQAVATAAASAWMFLVVAGLKGLVLALGGEAGRRRAGSVLRFGLMVALLAALLLSPQLTSPSVFARAAASRNWWLQPLLWFLGVDKVLAGSASGAWAALARRAWLALGCTALAASPLYALGCWRQFRAVLAVSGRGGSHGWARAAPAIAERLWLREPRERAVYRFAAATLARSRRHRLYLSAWLGVGVAFALGSGIPLTAIASHTVAGQARIALLAAPLVLSFFLLLGLRHIYTIPTELAANWIFRLSETGAQPERLGAAAKLMTVVGTAPVAALAALLTVWLWGWDRGLAQVATFIVLAALLTQVLLWRFRKLPFTCAYVPGKANVKLWWVVGWLGLTLYAHTAAAWEAHLWSQPGRLVAWLAIGAALAWALICEQRRWRGSLAGCQFDDEPEPLVQSLFERDA